MSISVSDAMQIKHLKHLELVAGKDGLSKMIDKIGILDHEIVEGVIDNFSIGDFVITTFTSIRDDERKLLEVIKDLIICDISALAIKKIFYKKLPENIIELANKKKLPIFMFEENVYFEDIIEDLLSGMQSRSRMEIISSKIKILFENDLKDNIVKELAYELNPNFFSEYMVIYLKERKYLSDENTLKLSERFHRSRSRSIHHSVFKYLEGLMIIITFEKITERDVTIDLNYIFNQLSIDKKDYYIGKSRFFKCLTQLDISIKESIYAMETSELLNLNEESYENIGIYKILLPYKNDKWLKQFASEILIKIKNYDNGKLLETARIYIKNNGDISKTASKMFQHKNTIRYRIKNLEKILKAKNGDFYEQLSIAIRSEKLTK